MTPRDREIRVESGNSTSCYQILEGGRLLYLRRSFFHSSPEASFDVFGPCWVFAWATLKPGQVRVARGNCLLDLSGCGILFIPPFGLMEWRVGTEPFEFTALLSTEPLPSFLPREPVRFLAGPPAAPRSLVGLFEQLHELGKYEPMGREFKPSAIARRTKGLIDANYTETKSLSDIARELKVWQPSMTTAFKRSYGLTPVRYRNRLRIFDSLRFLLLKDHPVSRVGHAVGFEDLSRFNKQFRRQMNAVPSQFRFSKRA